MVKMFVEVNLIGQTFCWSRQNSQNFYQTGQDWSDFLKEWMGLVKPSVGTVWIGQTFHRSRQNWSSFLQQQIGLVKFLWELLGFIKLS